jgi:hypothetical protein
MIGIVINATIRILLEEINATDARTKRILIVNLTIAPHQALLSLSKLKLKINKRTSIIVA